MHRRSYLYVRIPGIIKIHTALSDIIRILLLKKYGGVWIDSTVFCNNPLESRLPDYLTNPFFAFSKPGPDRLIATWFIAAHNDSYIIDQWYKSTINYVQQQVEIGSDTPVITYNEWKKNLLLKHYFWFHYIFGDLYSSNSKFKKAWDEIPEYSADGPHLLLKAGLLKHRAPHVIREIINKNIHPVFKLSYKFDKTKYYEGCVLDCLINKRK